MRAQEDVPEHLVLGFNGHRTRPVLRISLTYHTYCVLNDRSVVTSYIGDAVVGATIDLRPECNRAILRECTPFYWATDDSSTNRHPRRTKVFIRGAAGRTLLDALHM